jgi:hypothetical protein
MQRKGSRLLWLIGLALAGPAAGADLVTAAAADDGYRWSVSRGGVDVGIRFAARPPAVLPTDARFDSAAPAGATLPALSLGLRRFSDDPAAASSLVQRALGSPAMVPSESKVAIEWKPAQSQVFVNQGLGLRLGGGDKVTMRFRKGSLGIYMKHSF